MPEILAINPTRMELIKLRKKIRLTEKGRKLLKEKRDALILKFLEVIKKGGEVRDNVENFLQEAYKSLLRAQAVSGTLEVKSTAMAVREIPDVEIEKQTIMGTKVPELKLAEDKRDLSNRGYSPVITSVTLDEAAQKFENALKLVIELAEVEKSIKLLAGEVEKTKRRVNALEYIIIPRLDNTAKFIDMRLGEIEREDFARLKKIKAKLEAKGG